MTFPRMDAEGQSAAQVDDRIDLHARTGAMHLFDTATTLAIPRAE